MTNHPTPPVCDARETEIVDGIVTKLIAHDPILIAARKRAMRKGSDCAPLAKEFLKSFRERLSNV